MRRIFASLLCLALIATAALAQDVTNPLFYKQGTWTPTITSSGGGTPTYSAQTGFYEQIGRQVTARFTVTLATAGTLAVGNISIAGLPIAAVGSGMCTIVQYSVTGLTASSWGVSATILDAATSFLLLSYNNTSVNTITVAQAGATPFFIGTCVYKAS